MGPIQASDRRASSLPGEGSQKGNQEKADRGIRKDVEDCPHGTEYFIIHNQVARNVESGRGMSDIFDEGPAACKHDEHQEATASKDVPLYAMTWSLVIRIHRSEYTCARRQLDAALHPYLVADQLQRAAIVEQQAMHVHRASNGKW